MIKALIFDKDGTLFDFTWSWGAWVMAVLPHIAAGPQQHPAILAALGYNPDTQQFQKDSVVIAGTTPQIADRLAPLLPHLTPAQVNAFLNTQAAAAPMHPAVDLPAVLGALRARGLHLGLATNDTEAPARQHLARAGVGAMFDFIAGCDSGYGGKPQPGQLLAFARHTGLNPAQIAMVGDSLHDLHAARAAGMGAVGVLTGVALHADLAPHADVVLPDIGHIGAWLDRN
jgi:phosphoglycolate phosphatase